MKPPPFRCAVFCTADIPPSTLDTFLYVTEVHKLGSPNLFESEDFIVEEKIVIMTSEDTTAIPHALTRPVEPFQSPFIGKSIEDLAIWFDTNIIQSAVPGFWTGSFIVIEDDALKEQICSVVNMKNGPANIDILWCEFILALQMAALLDLDHPFEDAVLEKYMRLGLLMTLENLKLAINSGRYMEGMEVKINEDWKDFSSW